MIITKKSIFYADEWADEYPAVSGDLSEIAAQLAEGVRSADNDYWEVWPQAIPSQHAASKMVFGWISCQRRDDGGYEIPDQLPGEIHAVAFGDGLGWFPETMARDRDDAAQILREIGEDATEYLVVLISSETGTIHLHPGPVATFERAV